MEIILIPIEQTIDNTMDVSKRLVDIFSVDQAPFLKAVQEGFNLRNETTANHPKSYGGTRHYAEGTAILREELFPSGYEKYENHNSDWVKNKQLGILVNFMAGNAAVGLVKQPPLNDKPFKKPKSATNRNPKGVMFAEIAKAQLTHDLLTEQIPVDLPVDIWCWVLMYYIDYKRKTIRSEISCPSRLSVNGKYIEAYYERIILNEISFDPESDLDVFISPFGGAPTTEIDFEVRRKG